MAPSPRRRRSLQHKSPKKSTKVTLPRHNLTEEDIREFREIFRMVDIDDSGDISREELFTLMSQIGLNPTEQQVNEMMMEVDEDNNGSIDFNEFVTVMSQNQQVKNPEQIFTAFRVFDPENKGTITTDKIEYILSHYGNEDELTQEEVDKLISMIDPDHRGIVNYNEYVTIMTGGSRKKEEPTRTSTRSNLKQKTKRSNRKNRGLLNGH